MTGFILAFTLITSTIAPPDTTEVFNAETDGFKSIRIPCVLVTNKGTLLAVAEGREANKDQAKNKLLLKRSRDGGKTWSALTVIADAGDKSLNNPCAVLERGTGQVLLMYQSYPAGIGERNKRLQTGYDGDLIVRNLLITSADDGVTWSRPRDVTRQTKRAEGVTTVASGPGIGIQLAHGKHAGRLLIPFNEGPYGQWNIYAVFSDDKGKTWTMGQVAPGGFVQDEKKGRLSTVNEVQLVELKGGDVRMNARCWRPGALRKTCVSKDGGVTWSQIEDVPELRDPSCMGSILRYTDPAQGGRSRILYSGPQSDKRQNGTVFLSYNEGKTWPISRVLAKDGFAYSCLTALPDGTLGCLYEVADARRIVFARFTLDWLTQGKDRAAFKNEQDGPIPRVHRVTPPDAVGAVEVSVAINPTNPDYMVAASIATMKNHPGITNFAYVTTDAGRTWKMVPRANPHKVQQGDDVITFTPDGTAIHAFIAFAGIRQARPQKAHSGIVTNTSRDGFTWNERVPVVELFNSVEPHEDKPWIRADMSQKSPGRGNLYVAWTKFDVYGSSKPEHKSQVYFSRSLDSGKTFAVPHKISDQPGDALDKSDTVMGACPAVGPGGEVYVVWGGPKGVFFTKSTDAGVTFCKNTIISNCAGWDFPIKGLGRADGLPSIGVDISQGKDRGSLYVAWADTRHGDPDVFLITSRDGGQNWSKPQRINRDSEGNGKEQWFPWLVVDPVDGSVNIAYYDRAAHPDTLTDVTLARSVDGGRTFFHYKLNEEAYDLKKLGFFGDYLGLDCYGGRVAALSMHPVDGSKRLGISAAILDFEPGTQRARENKKDVEPKITPVPEDVIDKFKLDTAFYKKHLDYHGFSILSSENVSDAALYEARYLIDKLLGERPDILKAMIAAGCRFMVMAPGEMTTDVPEQRHWNKEYWDKRARGMGGKLSSCGEENLLNLKGDRYNKENILIHEFNHAIHQRGLRAIDPTFDGRLKEAFKNAMDKELWKGTYLTTNHSEYWAEGAQAYFDCMRPQFGANTREKLKEYDPELFALVDEVYRRSKFRYVRYDKRR